MAWVFDPNHSVVAFDNRHLGIAVVKGRFNRVQATVTMDEQELTHSSVEVTIDPASIDTGIERRDEQLQSDVYLDVARFPTAHFHSERIERRGDRYGIMGELLLHGATQQVELNATFNGEVVDQRGKRKRGFSATTTIRRSDFGIGTTFIEGIPMAGEEIRLSLEIEFGYEED